MPKSLSSDAAKRAIYDPDLLYNLERDYVMSVLKRNFVTTLFFASLDVSDLLERAFHDHVLGYKWRTEVKKVSPRKAEMTLGDIFVHDPNRKITLPYWVANGTAAGNNAIVPFMPDHLKLYRINGYWHREKHIELRKGKETEEAFLSGMSAAVGMAASCAVPGIPYTTMTTDLHDKAAHIQIADGGLADNLGAFTALRCLWHKETWITRKALILIDSYRGSISPFSSSVFPLDPSDTIMSMTAGQMSSWRGRSREIVKALCRSSDPDKGDIAGPIFLSFEDLRGASFADLGLTLNDLEKLSAPRQRSEDQPNKHAVKPESSEVMAWRKRNNNADPYTVARNVGTNLNVSTAEQKLLLAAGRYVARRKKAEITRALWGKPTEK